MLIKVKTHLLSCFLDPSCDEKLTLDGLKMLLFPLIQLKSIVLPLLYTELCFKGPICCLPLGCCSLGSPLVTLLNQQVNFPQKRHRRPAKLPLIR